MALTLEPKPDLSPLPDISEAAVSEGCLHAVPELLAPFVAEYGSLYVYACDLTGHLFIERTERPIAGAEQFFRIGPKGSFNQRARVYANSIPSGRPPCDCNRVGAGAHQDNRRADKSV